MDLQQILNDNYKGENNSFLYYLHEESHFDEESLSQLCQCISSLHHSHLQDMAASMQINFIYTQVLKHIIYHFDPNDYSRIDDLPFDYNEKLELLDTAVAQYFNADSSPSNPR